MVDKKRRKSVKVLFYLPFCYIYFSEAAKIYALNVLKQKQFYLCISESII